MHTSLLEVWFAQLTQIAATPSQLDWTSPQPDPHSPSLSTVLEMPETVQSNLPSIDGMTDLALNGKNDESFGFPEGTIRKATGSLSNAFTPSPSLPILATGIPDVDGAGGVADPASSEHATTDTQRVLAQARPTEPGLASDGEEWELGVRSLSCDRCGRPVFLESYPGEACPNFVQCLHPMYWGSQCYLWR